jgi:glycosyltransferase involved in cell wall biosynthesis
MKRILLIHQPTEGGVGRHVRDLAAGLPARGYEVHTCGPEAVDGLPAGCEHHALDLRRAITPAADAGAAVALGRLVRALRPAIVHAHSSKAGAVARLARWSSPRTPLFYTPHGYAFAGHFEHAAERRVYQAAERVLAPLATRVLCVCEAEARLARSLGGGARVRVVLNGVDEPPEGAPDPHVLELRNDGPLVGALTQARPGKGLDTLIEAVPGLRWRVPGARVVVIGGGPELESLRAAAERTGHGGAVQLLGPRDDPLAALRALDVFVHPSWAESLPYVVLEAMSLGKPVVATRVGGIAEAVADGVSGRLVGPRDPLALAAAVADVAADAGLSRRMGAEGLRLMRERFTLEGMLDRVTATYDEVLRTSGEPARCLSRTVS